MRYELEPEDLDDLAADLSRWSPEQVIELFKKIDQYMSDWTLVMDLKPWVDKQAKEYDRETAEEKKSQGMCYLDPDTQQSVHQSPHVGCILR